MLKEVIEKMRPQIEKLPLRLRIAFITNCAERSIQHYENWLREVDSDNGGVNILMQSITISWKFVQGETLNKKDLLTLAKQVVNITPDTEQYPNSSLGGGLDSPCSIGSIIDYLLQPQEIKYCLWAIEHSLQASDDLTLLAPFVDSLSRDEIVHFNRLRLNDATLFPLAREYQQQLKILTFLTNCNGENISNDMLNNLTIW